MTTSTHLALFQNATLHELRSFLESEGDQYINNLPSVVMRHGGRADRKSCRLSRRAAAKQVTQALAIVWRNLYLGGVPGIRLGVEQNSLTGTRVWIKRPNCTCHIFNCL